MAMGRRARALLRRMRRGGILACAALVAVGLLAPMGVSAGIPTRGPGVVFFPTTGHNVNGDILEFWHENGGVDRLGNPVTEEIRENGRAKQYFERAVVEYSPATGISFGRLGADFVAGRKDPAFRPITLDEFGTSHEGHRFFPETGHSVTGAFASYWEQNGDLTVFGYPLSEPLREPVGDGKQMVTVQYFERQRMEITPGPNGDTVRLANLGRDFAAKLSGTGTMQPAPKNGSAIEFSAALWPKWIDVNLKTQHLVAYEGNAIMQQFDITSGEPGHDTPTGVFQIFAKVKDERMKGDIGLPTAYDIQHVPWTMYFAGGGYAIHGAPWRSVFGAGTQLGGSHGCVNSPVALVATLYQWAPLGTTVVVHF